MKKFEYYKALRKAGIAEEHAISMVEQAEERRECGEAHEYILFFASWINTKEGDIFWRDLHEKFFNKFWNNEQS